MQYQDILYFWFQESTEKQWFFKDHQFDQKIKQKFLNIHKLATRCELFEWRTTSQGRLAEIIVLDQFSRNIYRNTPQAFLYDSIALCLAQEAVSLNIQKELSILEKSFLYLPFMHSESATIHEIAIQLYREKGLESSYEFECKHKLIIDRFGRYPHRNEILKRKSTIEELEFLKQPNSSF